MRLKASVEIYNRQLSSLNIRAKRPEKSVLTIGCFPGRNEIEILVQTRLNEVGTRYKIRQNVSQLFTTHLKAGKATIRLIDPPIDLKIKSEPQELAHFLQLLATQTKDKKWLNHLTNLAAVNGKLPPKEIVKLIVTEQKNLPGSEGYPRTLKLIYITGVGLKKIDQRIVRLQNLMTLILRDNCLEALPPQINLLPNLKELDVHGNNLGLSNDWRWLDGPFFEKNLTHLNLSQNKLMYVPSDIGKIKNLIFLNLGRNELTYLPNSLGHLRKLQELLVNKNKLKCFPASFQFLLLKTIDVSENEGYPYGFLENSDAEIKLLDIAAKAVLNYRLTYSEQTLPRDLIRYLENASYCICRSATFPVTPQAYVEYPLRTIAASVTYILSHVPLPLAVRTCSKKCCNRVKLSLLTMP